jgi:hypothetical protein
MRGGCSFVIAAAFDLVVSRSRAIRQHRSSFPTRKDRASKETFTFVPKWENKKRLAVKFLCESRDRMQSVLSKFHFGTMNHAATAAHFSSIILLADCEPEEIRCCKAQFGRSVGTRD